MHTWWKHFVGVFIIQISRWHWLKNDPFHICLSCNTWAVWISISHVAHIRNASPCTLLTFHNSLFYSTIKTFLWNNNLTVHACRENPILTGNRGTAALITTCSKRIGLLDSQFSFMCSILSLHSFLVQILLEAN